MRSWLLSAMLAAVAGMQVPLPTALADPVSKPAEIAIRDVLAEWALAFNAGDTGAVCNLFAPDLRYDYRGFPERGFEEMCAQLRASLTDPNRKFSYDLAIKEIMVAGDTAIVRLVWTLSAKRPGQVAGTSSYEPGLDVFRRQPDGSWKIVRYIAYEE
jgi:uncharacterized protein (TIGR02246 family)